MKNIVKHLSIVLLTPILVACADFMEEGRVATEVTRAESIATTDYYWLGDEKIPVQRMDNKFYVMYDSAYEERLKAELTRTGAVFVEMQDNDLLQYSDIKGLDTGMLSRLKTATIEGNYEKIAPVLSRAFYSAPYYKTDIGEGKLTNRFSIALKDAADLLELEKLAKENSVEILGVSELDGWYELACSNLSTGNALEMGNLFYETGLFKSVGYDLGARGTIN